MFSWPDVWMALIAITLGVFIMNLFHRRVNEEAAKKETQGDLDALAEKAKRDVEGADLNSLVKRVDERYRTKRDRRRGPHD